ncbi:MAG TPA: PqqD family protein [Actinomycetota bacterium]
MTIDPPAFRRVPHAPWRSVGDDVYVAPLGRAELDRLAGPAATAWRVLETPASMAELLGALGEAYSMPTDAILPEVEEMVRELLARGLIEGADGGSD